MEKAVPSEEGEAILADRNRAAQIPDVPSAQSLQKLRSQLDISEQRKAEEDQARLAAIVESSEDAIISKGLDGIVTSWNEGARRLFGYSAEEMLGQPVSRIIPAERSEEEVQILARLRRGERVEHYETVRRHKDGRLVDADTLRLCAQSLSHSKSALGAKYRRLRARLGAPKAIVAMAHHLARLVYRMLRYGENYVEKGIKH